MTDTSSIFFSQQIENENDLNANFGVVQSFDRIKRNAVLVVTCLSIDS